MGGNNSRVLTLVDIVHVREWLLITLQSRFRIENARSAGCKSPKTSSIQNFLLQTFQRYDAPSRGFVEREAALVIAHDLTLDNKRTHNQIESFCELFVPEDCEYSDNDGGGGDNSAYFNYRLFLSFVFFPIEHQGSRLKLKACIAKVGRFEVYPGELVSEWLSPGLGTEGGGIPVIAKKLSLMVNDSTNNNSSGDGEEQGALARLRDQVDCLRLFSHPNITRYHSVMVQFKINALYLVEEPHQSCTLRTILESFGAMKEPTIRRYLLQLLQALQFLHARDIPHGNLSTQTVNINSYGLLKLSEFGIGSHLNQVQPRLVAETPSEAQDWTTKFPPPEAAKVPFRGKQSDIWCVGILILQMANGFSNKESESTPMAHSPLPPPPRSRHTYGQQRSPQKRSASLPFGSPQKKPSPDPKSPSRATTTITTTPTLPTLPQTISKSLRTLARACLQRNPRKRARVDQLIEMEFFQVDAAQATNEMLRTVCTDLDASMKRLISSSSSVSTSPNAKLRSFSGSGSSVRIPGRSTLVQQKYKSTVPAIGKF